MISYYIHTFLQVLTFEVSAIYYKTAINIWTLKLQTNINIIFCQY